MLVHNFHPSLYFCWIRLFDMGMIVQICQLSVIFSFCISKIPYAYFEQYIDWVYNSGLTLFFFIFQRCCFLTCTVYEENFVIILTYCLSIYWYSVFFLQMFSTYSLFNILSNLIITWLMIVFFKIFCDGLSLNFLYISALCYLPHMKFCIHYFCFPACLILRIKCIFRLLKFFHALSITYQFSKSIFLCVFTFKFLISVGVSLVVNNH